ILDAKGKVIGASKIARDISDRKYADAERARLLAAAQEYAAMLEKLNHVGGIVASELNRASAVEAVTDGAREVTGAEFAAFFYSAAAEPGRAQRLQAVSGGPRDAFADFPNAHTADVFGSFQVAAPIRSDDITRDARYAHLMSYDALTGGRLRVRSYLAVPLSA